MSRPKFSKIIFDFDDTLFDTWRLKQDWAKLLRHFGVDRKLFIESYLSAYKNKRGLASYSFDRQLLALAKFLAPDSLVKIKKQKQKLERTFKKYTLSGAEKFLLFCQQTGFNLILLSRGCRFFQKLKIEKSGLKNLFNNIIITNRHKVEALRKLDKGWRGAGFLINDKIKESQEIAAVFPKLKIILKISPVFSLRDYQKSRFPHFKTFKEILNYLNKYV